MGSALTGESGGLLVLAFGIGAAENPTISIVPIEGEEFTKRLMTPFTAKPFTANKLTLRLRSFFSILNFLGETIDDDPEFFVEKDPRTDEVAQNPNCALEILEGKDEPDGADLSVYYKGHSYAVAPDSGYPWNASGFQLLHQIFQMAVSELSKSAAPGITNAK